VKHLQRNDIFQIAGIGHHELRRYSLRASAGIATITINRPDKYNAFRGQTCEELIHALQSAGSDRSVAVIVLTGAGDKAFCTGGDQSSHEGGYDGRGVIGLPIGDGTAQIMKMVIARQRLADC
jgi:1,4-dihydroxy-2-naphthoyl-CoA synthase